MNISNVDAEAMLVENAVTEYEEGMGFFYSELIDLNVNIYILDRIAEFPFDLFVAPDDRIFWDLVIRNFFNAGVLTITRLATDNAVDLHTLISFKNRVRELVKPEYKQALDDRLRQARFDRETHALLERARQLRVSRIAHTRKGRASEVAETPRIDFTGLKSLRDALNSLLDALSFNVEYRMLPIPYDPQVIHPAGSDTRTDIEKILDSLARDSYFLNMPERNPERWRHRRGVTSEEKLRQLNYYRRKFNLPEV